MFGVETVEQVVDAEADAQLARELPVAVDAKDGEARGGADVHAIDVTLAECNPVLSGGGAQGAHQREDLVVIACAQTPFQRRDLAQRA